MSKSIDQLLNEADTIIEKRASDDTQSQEELDLTSDDEVVKLASFLMEEDKEFAEQVTPPKSTHEKVASTQVSEDEVNMGTLEPQSVYIEKIAESLAIVDTLINIQELAKAHEFEKRAKAAGYNDEQIEEYLQKQAKAAAKGVGTAGKAMLAALGLGGAAGTGAVVGRKKGKQEGYGEALGDVEQAFRQYNQAPGY